MSPECPFLSVLVPTYRRPEHLRSCLASLVAQDYPAEAFEIVVADDGSPPATREVVRAFVERSDGPPVRYLRSAHRGVNHARNRAVAAARGDLLCLVDDDEEMPPSWLAAMAAGFAAHPEAWCVGGPMRLRLDGRPPRTCGQEPLGESELDLGPEPKPVDHVWGGNLAFRRSAFERVGPFREDLRVLGGTEIDWQDRVRQAGGCVVYLPGAWLWHVRSGRELRLWFLVPRHLRRGRGQAINAERVGDPFAVDRIARALRASLAHAVRARCTVGLLDSARHAGRLEGIAEWRVRAWLSRRGRADG